MFERRLKVLLLILTLMTVGLIARAFAIQVLGRSHWEEESTRAMADETPAPTTRGRILDFKGRELAVDKPCIDAAVDYRAILFDPEPIWSRRTARARLARRDEHFLELPRARRKQLIDAEIEQVKRDIDGMWRELARLSNQTMEQMDEQRRQIIRRVETRRRIVWYNKFERAMKNQKQRESGAWYSWLLGETADNIDKYDVTVGEQMQKHTIISNIDYTVRLRLEREIERYPGLSLEPGLTRWYPYQAIGCHIIGNLRAVEQKELVDKEISRQQTLEERLGNYIASDKTGRAGMEALLEDSLRGRRGIEVRDGMGNVLKQIPSVPGRDVRSSIDIVLQASIEEMFQKIPIVAYNGAPVDEVAMPGAAVVIDVETGQVRAMASYPIYDLNKFDELYAALSRDVINKPLLNRATSESIEPGSIVKPLIGIAAITEGLIGPRDTIECTGYLVLGGNKYQKFGRCWTMSQFKISHHQVPSSHPHPNGFLTYADAIERSCNVYFETLGDRLGVERVAEWFDRFGLGRPTGVGVRESSGLIPDDDQPLALRRQTAWFAAIGQGQISATPIQIANVAATLAREGIWKRPTLLASAGPNDAGAIDLKLSREALNEARRGMINVVQGGAGTGSAAQVSALLVAAKTGSAQPPPLAIARRTASGELIRDERGRAVFDKPALGTRTAPNPLVPWYRGISETESKVNSHAWMMAYAPADNPKLAVAVMIPYGGGGGYAAGSVVHRILEAAVEQGYLPSGKR